METINSVFLSGNLVSDAVFEDVEGRSWCYMEVRTFRSSWNGSDKVKTPEIHEVRAMNVKSLQKYLNKGKSVIIQGRVVPSSEASDDFIMASSITFPGSGSHE